MQVNMFFLLQNLEMTFERFVMKKIRRAPVGLSNGFHASIAVVGPTVHVRKVRIFGEM